MATPTQAPNQHIKSSARKLPIKRKTPANQQHLSQSPIHPTPLNSTPFPNPNPNPNASHIVPDPSSLSLPPPPSAAFDDDYDDDEFDEESQDQEADNNNNNNNITALSSSATSVRQPPFKFHRIWSESDEIRFLQGLLGCWSQGLVFPRDLNLFYDRFSESMPQPYTRSQLSEKLRRLRKKFRIMSSRISRGQDPSRLAPHDRDLLHLCTRLWDPTYAPTSPFSPPDPASSATAGNKRRRPNPRTAPPPPLALPAAPQFSPEKVGDEEPVPVPEVPTNVANGKIKDEEEDIGFVTARAVLDVFDGSLKELRSSLQGEGDSSSRWREQRVAELDVFARRLRLMLEHSLRT